MMTPHDKELVEQAKKVRGYNYTELDRLADLCETEEARSEINSILNWRYHQEEAISGCL